MGDAAAIRDFLFPARGSVDCRDRHAGRGALAIGAAAVGGFAIGRLSVRRLEVDRTTFGRLAVEELEIGQLDIRERTGTDDGA